MLNPIQHYFPKLHRFLSNSSENSDIDNSVELSPHTLHPVQGSTLHPADDKASSVSILLPLGKTELLNRGHAFLKQGQFKEAIAHYRHVIQLDPTSGTAYQYLAEALSQQGDLEESADCYRQAIALSISGSALETSSPVRVTGWVEASSHGEVEDSQDEDDQDEELAWFEEAAFYLQQGDVLCNLGDWTEAIAASTQAIDLLEPQLAAAYVTAGRAWQQQGELDAAEQVYEKAIAIQPQSASTHARLASLYAQQQRFTQAIAYYQQAIALDPQFAGAYWKLADLWEQINEPDQALTCRYQALQLSPDWATPPEHVNLGHCLCEQGKLDWAISCYQQAIQSDVNFSEAYHHLGQALGRQGNWTTAAEAHQQQSCEIPTMLNSTPH